MAWEWVAPIAGATVGIAGITSAWLTSRQATSLQRDLMEREQLDRRAADLRATRRAVYSTYIAAVFEAARDLAHIPRVMTSFAEVSLVGSEAVVQAARPHLWAATDLFTQKAKSLNAEDVPPAWRDLLKLTHPLLNAMRIDLGAEGLASDLYGTWPFTLDDVLNGREPYTDSDSRG